MDELLDLIKYLGKESADNARASGCPDAADQVDAVLNALGKVKENPSDGALMHNAVSTVNALIQTAFPPAGQSDQPEAELPAEQPMEDTAPSQGETAVEPDAEDVAEKVSSATSMHNTLSDVLDAAAASSIRVADGAAEPADKSSLDIWATKEEELYVEVRLLKALKAQRDTMENIIAELERDLDTHKDILGKVKDRISSQTRRVARRAASLEKASGQC